MSFKPSQYAANRRRQSWPPLALIFVVLAGCGPSQEDLMMRAAMRVRPTAAGEEEEDDDRTAPPSPASAPSVAPEPADPAADPADDAAVPAVVETSATAPVASPGLSVSPISERQPAEPLDEAERRAIAAENLSKISAALMAFREDKGFYPPAATSTGGFKTLSWRVTILPYLGYDDLYKKFDPKIPWNQGRNKDLLQFIPNEFVSPERFDTRTNWQVPAHKNFMFGENRTPVDRVIEDGIANTIMLVEVKDELAVPWTQPADFKPDDRSSIRDALGAQRGDGAFAAWANGWTTLLSTQLSNNRLYNALTYESGDGQRAGDVHTEISVQPVELVSFESKLPPEPTADAAAATDPDRVVRTARIGRRGRVTERLNRPVPSPDSLDRARQRIASIYAERIRDAEQPEDHARLADEMLREATRLESDPAGAYTLQSAAMKQAVEGQNIKTLLKAVDARVQQFDVDAYDTNATALLEFVQRAAREDSNKRATNEFNKRAIATILAAIRKDDYDRAGRLAGAAIRLSDDSSRGSYRVSFRGRDEDEEKKKKWTRLRSLLGSTKGQFDQAADMLAKYRNNPDDEAAAAAVGQFLCFIKGDWEIGLPLLVEGGGRTLRAAAQRDLAGADSAEQQTALGDMWWDLAQKAKQGVYRQGAIDRAAHWYEMALEQLPDSLEKIHVRARLDEIQEMNPGSPIAALRQVANELRIPIDQTLEDLAMGNVRRLGRNDDD